MYISSVIHGLCAQKNTKSLRVIQFTMPFCLILFYPLIVCPTIFLSHNIWSKQSLKKTKLVLITGLHLGSIRINRSFAARINRAVYSMVM